MKKLLPITLMACTLYGTLTTLFECLCLRSLLYVRDKPIYKAPFRKASKVDEFPSKLPDWH
ncbi:hypothetical protein [Sinomicrobium sp. M5D2P17]